MGGQNGFTVNAINVLNFNSLIFQWLQYKYVCGNFFFLRRRNSFDQICYDASGMLVLLGFAFVDRYSD